MTQSVPAPSKVVCIGKNYADHIEEMGGLKPDDMTVFVKPPSAITTVLQAYRDEPVHYETEICFRICDHKLVAVGLGLDLTKRETQGRLKQQGLPWERAKAFDGSALFSEFVALPDEVNDLSLTLHVDDDLRQKGHISMMLYPPHVILSELSSFMSLADHDIIMTGTPAGVGPLEAGQCYQATLYKGSTILVSQSWIAV